MGSEGKQLGRTGGELTSKPSSKKNRERLRSEPQFGSKVVRLMMVELVRVKTAPCPMLAMAPRSDAMPSKWQLTTAADALGKEEGTR